MSESKRGGGLRQIGSLTTNIENSLRREVTTSGGFKKNLNNSETIAPQKALNLKMPTLLSERGLGTLPSLSEAFTARDPRNVEKVLTASLPPSVKRSITSIWSTLGDEQFGWDGDFEGMAVTTPIPRDDVGVALIMISKICVPASKQEIVASLGVVKLTTISRNSHGEDLSMSIAAYAGVLMKYPADAVIDALHYWSENEKFWPSLSEVVALVQRRMRRRMALKKALEGLCAP